MESVEKWKLIDVCFCVWIMLINDVCVSMFINVIVLEKKLIVPNE